MKKPPARHAGGNNKFGLYRRFGPHPFKMRSLLFGSRIALKGIAMPKDTDDLGTILELLEKATAIAERVRLDMLGYLLSMVVMEATEQIRIRERFSEHPRERRARDKGSEQHLNRR